MRRLYKDRWGYAFIAPSFALFAVFFLVPVVWGGYLSLLDYQVFNKEWVGLQNYREIARDSVFWLSLRNTALYTLGLVPLWLARRCNIRVDIPLLSHQTFFKGAFYLPHVTSSVIISMVWLWIFNPPFGLLNYIMELLGSRPTRGWATCAPPAVDNPHAGRHGRWIVHRVDNCGHGQHTVSSV